MADEFFAQLLKATAPAVRALLASDPKPVEEWRRRARAAHPALTVSSQRFAQQLGRHLTPEAVATPSSLQVEDLYLALACLEGDPAGLAQLDRLLQYRKHDDEVIQRIRAKLLVGPSPRLEQYAGRSALKAWVGLAIKREVIDASREEAREVGAAPRTLAGVIDATAELRLVGKDAAAKVGEALKRALSALPQKDRDLLRGHYLEGKTHAQLAVELRTSRSTVALWIEKARERLLAQTRTTLQKQIRLDSAELDSLIQVVEGHLDLSFSELQPD